jgi:hypothetical protein
VPQDPSPDDTPEDLPSDPSPDPSPDGGSGGTDDGELLDGSDPFEHLTLDESFVSSAAFNEPAAAERERQRVASERAERQANLQRMLADEQTLREHQRYGQHRNAPGEWDEWDDPYADHERPRRGGRGRVVRLVAVLVVLAMVVV